MIDETAADLTRNLKSQEQLWFFCSQLLHWLIRDQPEQAQQPGFPESRARSLLVSPHLLDQATLDDFYRLLATDIGPRVSIYDLLVEVGLTKDESVSLIVASSLSASAEIEEERDFKELMTPLTVAAFSWKNGYSVHQFDPGSPPNVESPAGHVLKRASQFIRRQVQRSATERDRLNSSLTRPPSRVPSLDELGPLETNISPLPPHYRSPVPVRYPEMASETVHIESDDLGNEPSIEIGDPVVISSEDVGPQEEISEPVRMPPISIKPDQIVGEPSTPTSPLPANAVVIPTSTNQTRPSLAMSIRHRFSQESMTNTKLKVVVQRYPDGPGLYGLQVRVTSKGIKSYVAGTTNRDGLFLCELPVRMQSGLTYDVQLTWPRDLGGEIEYKSITLNADRTLFTLPFYRQLTPPEQLP